jgi:uncharacterized protein (TIGR00369 family)
LRSLTVEIRDLKLGRWGKQMKGKLPAYGKSFFLSPTRKDGLQLAMFYEDGLVYTDLFVDSRFEGYSNVVHGGMIFGVLDVILWYIILMETKKMAMTRKVEMEFFKPIMCDKHYRAQGKFIRIEKKDIHAVAWVEDKNGEVYARVNAVFREGKETDMAAVIGRFDFSSTAPELKKFFLSVAQEN